MRRKECSRERLNEIKLGLRKKQFNSITRTVERLKQNNSAVQSTSDNLSRSASQSRIDRELGCSSSNSSDTTKMKRRS
ncbi:Fusarin C synthetase [Dirofilaria immitis]